MFLSNCVGPSESVRWETRAPLARSPSHQRVNMPQARFLKASRTGGARVSHRVDSEGRMCNVICREREMNAVCRERECNWRERKSNAQPTASELRCKFDVDVGWLAGPPGWKRLFFFSGFQLHLLCVLKKGKYGPPKSLGNSA